MNLPGYDTYKLSNGRTRMDDRYSDWFQNNEDDLREEFCEAKGYDLTDYPEDKFKAWAYDQWRNL